MVKIYCPKCKWEPTAQSLWNCNPGGCNHSWNTFDTYGVCPGCGKAWRDTSCHACGKWSPHHDWYHDDTDMTNLLEKIQEEEKISIELTR
jgi:hypothetical protein